MHKHDSDRFFCALLAGTQERERLFTLLAFNHEIAKIRSIVSEPIMGQMRLQWWREAIEAAQQGKPPLAHEVAQPLMQLVVQEPALATQLFALLEARERDLDDAPFASLDEVEEYACATTAPLLAALGGEGADTATGYALVGLLRAREVEGVELVKAVASRAQALLQARARGQGRYWQALAKAYLRQLVRAHYDLSTPYLAQSHPLRGLILLWARITG